MLQDYVGHLPHRGRALDLACGLGANALYLSQHGLQVDAWDISPVAIARLRSVAREQGANIQLQVRDVLAHPPAANSYELIVVSRFLERELCHAIHTALKPGGLLFYQTFSVATQGGAGPSNPHFLLQQGELLSLFPSLTVVAYEEGDEVMYVGRRD